MYTKQESVSTYHFHPILILLVDGQVTAATYKYYSPFAVGPTITITN